MSSAIRAPSPAEIRALKARDPRLGAALARVPRYPGVVPATRRMSTFAYLSRAIVYQQLAGAAARTIYGRVCRLTPGPGFPSPREILALPEEALRAAGLSAAKRRSITELAAQVEAGTVRLAGLSRLPDDEVVARLTTVWGIGEWSAQMYLMFKLGRLDVMPGTDLGIREGLRRLDERTERPTPAEVVERAEPWRPLRTVASWVLWRLCDER